MKLIIDRGNTFYKVAVFDNDELVELKTYRNLTIPDLEAAFLSFDIKKSIFCSVGGTEKTEILDFLKGNSEFVSMTEQLVLPIRIAYKTPLSLGKDRIASVVGASQVVKGKAVLVIDAGSCICFDYLGKDAVYHGGSIAPGLGMKYKALHNFTADLPLLDLESESIDLCGQSTDTCIHSGVINGTLCEISGIIDLYREIDKDLVVMLSGGDADFIAERLNRNVIVEKHLVLQGLNVILDANTK